MSGDSPWYVEHSKRPEGPYAPIPFRKGVRSDPADRRGTVLDYGPYTDTSTQRIIANGLAILHDEPDRVLLIGGDQYEGFRQKEYYYIRWGAEQYQYELLKEGETREDQLQNFTGVTGLFRLLDDEFPNDVSVFVHLIWTLNSPFHCLDNPVGSFTIGA